MPEQPIAYIIGVEGHFYTAEALKDEFRRPVVAVVLTQGILSRMNSKRRQIFDRIFSFPDFYMKNIAGIEALSWDELNAEQSRLEEKFGIETSALLTYFDRDLQNVSSFPSTRRHQLAFLRFAELILWEVRPAFVLDGVALYFQNLLRLACQKLGIPYVHTMSIRGEARLAFFSYNGQQLGMQEIFLALRRGQKKFVSDAVLNLADQWYDLFLDSPHRPSDAILNSRLDFSWSRAFGKLYRELHPARLRAILGYEVDRAIGYQIHPLRYVYTGIHDRICAFYHTWAGIFEERPDLSVPFIYFPLHFSPEISDMIFGTQYDHHEGFVTQLAKRLPSDVELYVKEHTSMLGRRPIEFYRHLNSLYNIKIISPRVDTFTLIRNSRAVLTVTGTAGWEAYLLNKPVVVLGDVFYNFLPGVLKTGLDAEFPRRLKQYLKTFSADSRERRDAVRACFASSYEATKGDTGAEGDTLPENARKNAQSVARAFRDFISNWGDRVGGQFPQDLLSKRQRGQLG